MRVIEVDPAVVAGDDLRPPDGDGFDAYVYFAKRSGSVGAVTVTFLRDSNVIVSGSVALAASLTLGMGRIRVVEHRDSDPAVVDSLIATGGATLVDHHAEQTVAPSSHPAPLWLIVSAERPFQSTERDAWEERIGAVLRSFWDASERVEAPHKAVSDFTYNDEHCTAEVLTLEPGIEDRALLGGLLAAVRKFDAEVLPIVSVQGRPFRRS